MKRNTIITGLMLMMTSQLQAQISGNVQFDPKQINYTNQPVYRQPFYSIQKNEVEFNMRIQYHARINEYIVTFGVSEEASDVETCSVKILGRIERFIKSLKAIDIPEEMTFVDDITHNRVYEFVVDEGPAYGSRIATEKVVGFVIKKNVMIRYKDHLKLTEINKKAAAQGIYDMIKVDYKIEPIEDVLIALVPDLNDLVKKRQELIRLSGAFRSFKKHRIGDIQVRSILPVASYRSYTAQSSNRVDMTGYRYATLTRISARKESTLYYQPEDANNFDLVRYGNENELVPTIIYEIHVKVKCKAR